MLLNDLTEENLPIPLPVEKASKMKDYVKQPFKYRQNSLKK
jgi:hypothetical protein